MTNVSPKDNGFNKNAMLQKKGDSHPSVDSRRLTTRHKIIYTMIHNYIHLLFGLTLSSMAPAFVDYKEILHTEMRWIGLFPMFQAIGIFFGSFFTYTYRWINRQIALSILVILQGLGTMFQPWSSQLWHLYVCIFVYGFGIGNWNGANNVILIEMWQEKSPSILQFSQFIYGVGTILGPLLTEKFVIGEQVCPGFYPEEVPDYCHYNQTEGLAINNSQQQWCDDCLNYDRRPEVKTPLLIGGLLQLIGPAMMILMFFVKPYHFDQTTKVEVVFSEEQKKRHKKCVPTKTIVFCTAVFLAFGIMSENMYMDFAPTFYQYCGAGLNASEASRLFSLIAIALTVGRGLSVFVAMFLKPWHMISYQSAIVFCGHIFQYFAQHDYKLLLASSLIICFGYSSIFICLFSFVGQYMEVTDRIGGLLIGSSYCVYMFLPYFIGENIRPDPSSFVFVEFGSMCIAIISFLVVMFAVRNVPKDLIRKLRPLGGH